MWQQRLTIWLYFNLLQKRFPNHSQNGVALNPSVASAWSVWFWDRLQPILPVNQGKKLVVSSEDNPYEWRYMTVPSETFWLWLRGVASSEERTTSLRRRWSWHRHFRSWWESSWVGDTIPFLVAWDHSSQSTCQRPGCLSCFHVWWGRLRIHSIPFRWQTVRESTGRTGLEFVFFFVKSGRCPDSDETS